MNIEILLVEDDEPTARLLRKMLEGVGMSVQRAATVAQGIAMLNTEPALVVLDLTLPDGCGVEVLNAVRSRHPRCKVAVVSATNDPILLAAVTALRPEAIFAKPLDFDEFVVWISSIFTEDPVASFRLAV